MKTQLSQKLQISKGKLVISSLISSTLYTNKISLEVHRNKKTADVVKENKITKQYPTQREVDWMPNSLNVK